MPDSSPFISVCFSSKYSGSIRNKHSQHCLSESSVSHPKTAISSTARVTTTRMALKKHDPKAKTTSLLNILLREKGIMGTWLISIALLYILYISIYILEYFHFILVANRSVKGLPHSQAGFILITWQYLGILKGFLSIMQIWTNKYLASMLKRLHFVRFKITQQTSVDYILSTSHW